MLKNEFKFYIDNQIKLLEKYNGKYIVIKDKKVLGAYNSNDEALNKTIKNHKLGTFLIQLCTPGSEAYTQKFYSRVIV